AGTAPHPLSREPTMTRAPVRLLLACLLTLGGGVALAGDEPPFQRQEDAVYGRKFGTALTLDVFRPTGKANGAAVIHVISGGWFSSHEAVNPAVAAVFAKR